MDAIELIGSFAAVCTTFAFLPQAVKVLRDGQTQGISLLMYAIFTLGVATWFLYGLLIASLPLIFANAVTLILAGLILGVKVRLDTPFGRRINVFVRRRRRMMARPA